MNKLNVLKVIHGYPPYYMAGSEVYTYNLCNELSKFLDISIFTRIEDIYLPPYEVEVSKESGIKVIRVNKPQRDYIFRDKYIDEKMARIFEDHLLKIKPDIIHIGHLSHLTVLIVDIIKRYNIPIIFTLHDYWMICVKGQLIRKNFELCTGPSVEKCYQCNEHYFHNEQTGKREIRKWLRKMDQINHKIDLFIAPSKFLKNVYIKNGIPSDKLIHMDYGFNKEYFQNIERRNTKKIRFGYLGRIIPVKGINLLIDCFNEIDPKKAQLNIYGRINASQLYLKNKIKNSNIHLCGGYEYWDIGKILANIDVLIAPSIWYENSPLVIHEALLANIPVITSDLGGMAELIKHGKNGLLFEPKNIDDLKKKINLFVDRPVLIGELTIDETQIRSIKEDVKDLIKIYNQFIKSERELSQFAG
ncbi:MAG: Glycosyl transferase group 1 [Promethearchaeota archaeon]|nr:MAG: Glycosyl transferase group 1 [Candidatus Lokiarchaeota archaeon]